jgi:hypothetical protein
MSTKLKQLIKALEDAKDNLDLAEAFGELKEHVEAHSYLELPKVPEGYGEPEVSRVEWKGFPHRTGIFLNVEVACDRIPTRSEELPEELERTIRKIAQEAHIMGRIYNQCGEPDSPADEFEKVKSMVDRVLKANEVGVVSVFQTKKKELESRGYTLRGELYQAPEGHPVTLTHEGRIMRHVKNRGIFGPVEPKDKEEVE